MALTAAQKRFVEEYVASLNATQAYRKSYPRSTPRSAQANAARLMANDRIRSAIEAALAERSERCKVDADYVLQGLKAEAERMGDGASHSARVAALHLLGKHLGMFTERVEVKEPVQLNIVRKLIKATDAELDAEIKRLQGV